MKLRSITLALATANLVVASRADAFCGFYVSGSNEKLANDATQVVLMRDGTRTALSMQNDYRGPPEKFAMVVPVPIVLKKENVKTLPRDVFAKIEELDAPRLVEYWETDPCAPDLTDAFGAGGLGLSGFGSGGGGTSGAVLGVKVEAQFEVGEYEIVILSAKDSSGLETWLKQEKYAIPDGAEPVLRPYVTAGMKFFVAKVDPAKVKFEDGRATLSPLRFHYDSETFSLPVRLGLLNSSGTQDLIVHVLGKKRYEAANYPNVVIPTNFDVSDATRADFAPFYAALFDQTVAKHPKAVVTEYAWSAGSCDPCPTPPLQANQVATLGGDVMPTPVANDDPSGRGMGSAFGYYGGVSGWVLTRLHLRYGKDALGEDVVFREAPAIEGGREGFSWAPRPQDGGDVDRYGASPATTNAFQARYVIRHRWPGAITCDHPIRDRWGGPWPNDAGAFASAPSATAAKKLAYARRGNVQLASFVRSDVPGVSGGQAEPALTPAPSASTPSPATSASAAPTAGAKGKGCASCTVADGDGGGLAVLGGGAFVLFSVARRARRARRTKDAG
jgi:hypothetical protein